MTLLRKLSLMMIALFTITTAFADYNGSCDTSCDPEPVNCECPKPCGCDQPAGPTMSAYNHPANIDVCGSWDFFVTGTFLWWQPIQEQMEFAETTFAITGTTNVGELHNFSFDWKPGFKVGLGYNFGYDNWNAYFQYTRMNTNMSNTQNVSTVAGALLNDTWLLQSFVADTNNAASVYSKWDLDFNMFDFEMGRPYYNGTELTFRPHFGLKGGWIDQTMFVRNTSLTADTVYEGTFKSDSWMIGPRAGIYTNWNLGEGFRLFGNAAASMFYQKFDKVTLREPLQTNTALWYQAEDLTNSFINTSMDAMIGFGYGTYFDNNNWYFDLLVGYETQVYFEQNMMRYLQAFTMSGDVPTKPGNLMFQGLNVTARFDF